MALILVVLGLILWLALGYTIIGIVLLVIGLLLFFTVPGVPYGYSTWHGRRGPP